MRIGLDFLAHAFQFPAATEPAWSGQVERWYQLDASAYGVADATHTWQRQLRDRPDLVILASPDGSNHTDWLFAHTEGTSPSLFVHTLPSTRGSAFCQVMNWNGPVLCIQNGPITRLTALREAVALLDQEIATVWIVSVQLGRIPDAHAAVHLLTVRTVGTSATFEIETRRGAQPADDASLQSDAPLLAWLRDGHPAESVLQILGGYVLTQWAEDASRR